MTTFPVCRRALPLMAVLAWAFLLASRAGVAAAQETTNDAGDAIAVATAALDAITAEDMVALTDLMVDEAVVMATFARDGVPGYRARTREQERSSTFEVDIVERGFDADARVAGGVAMVWLPYDLYVDGAWSHCGVDVFTLVRTDRGWKIASLAYSVEQPPACAKHPDGPPKGG